MRMTIRSGKLHRAACALAILGFALAGCSSSNSSDPAVDNSSGNTPPEEIHGIAMTSSVAVVTATNAN